MEKIPLDLNKALASAPAAKAQWKDLTPISRRDFATWITSAKQSETRKRRVKKALDMLVSGKRRPCCYAVVPMDLYRALGSSAKAKAGWSKLSSDERRDFADWVGSSKGKEESMNRVAKALMLLAAGKRHP